MISSKHRVFAKIATKLDRARQEPGKIDGYLDSIEDSDLARARTAFASFVEAVAGLERAMTAE